MSIGAHSQGQAKTKSLPQQKITETAECHTELYPADREGQGLVSKP